MSFAEILIALERFRTMVRKRHLLAYASARWGTPNADARVTKGIAKKSTKSGATET